MNGNGAGKDATTVGAHRFQVLDSWRGLCALLVVFYHFRIISHLSALDIVKHGDVAVDFFFVLSGFVLAHAYSARLKGEGEFVVFAIRRLGRLYPLHLATLGVLVVMELAHLGLAIATGQALYRPAFEGPTSLPTLAANLVLLHGLGLFHSFSWNVPSWSISVELYVSLLFALLAASRRSEIMLFAVFFVAFAIRLILWLDGIWPYEGDLALIRGLCGFFLGVQVFGLFLTTGAKFRNMLKFLELLSPIVFVIVIVLDDHGCGFLDPFMFGFLVLVFGFEAGILSRILRSHTLQYIGKISYSIYMIHYIMIMIVFGVVSLGGKAIGISLRSQNSSIFMDVGSRWTGDIVQIGLVAGVVGCAVLSYNFVETPGRVLFNRLASSWAARVRTV